MTGPPCISATPAVVGSEVRASRSAWTTIWVGPERFSSPVGVHSSTNPSAIRCGYGSKMPDSGFTGIRSARALISDSTSAISAPGNSRCHPGTNPIQGVLDREPPFPPRIHHISRRRRIRSPGGTVESSIGQLQTLGDHRRLGIRSGQLRNRIDLIQTHLAGGEPGTQNRQILQSAGHPNQLSSSGMPETKPGRHPLREIPRPIHQKPLTPIRIDQPFTDLGIENGQTREQMRQDPIGLIIAETLPLHHPNVRNRCDKFGSETKESKKKSEKFRGPRQPSTNSSSSPSWSWLASAYSAFSDSRSR